MKIIEHTEQLAEALRAVLENDYAGALDIGSDDPSLIQARAALAAWDRHNETTKGDDRVKAHV